MDATKNIARLIFIFWLGKLTGAIFTLLLFAALVRGLWEAL